MANDVFSTPAMATGSLLRHDPPQSWRQQLQTSHPQPAMSLTTPNRQASLNLKAFRWGHLLHHNSSSSTTTTVSGRRLRKPWSSTSQTWLRLNHRRTRSLVCSSSVSDSSSGESEQPYGIPDRPLPSQWDVIGLGQAMVDFCGFVGDDFIDRLQLEKGVRKVVDHEERGKVLQALDGRSYKVSAGGSLSNTLVALARLGMGRINVAMTGSVGKDPLGDFYRTKLLRANVHFLSKPIVNGTTGTVIVLTTPDAQRAMLSYQGMSSVIEYDLVLAEALSASRILIVEGYLWEIPQTIEALSRACKAAREANVLVALTASDVSCISRHREEFWEVMQSSADILFANSDEAIALCGFGENTSPALAAEYLSKFCSLVSVTDGARGSYIALRGSVVYIPPSPSNSVDTCGAGDAYAAGMLYGLLCGAPDLRDMGNLAAKVAATVVSQQGTRLKQEDAVQLTTGFFTSASEFMRDTDMNVSSTMTSSVDSTFL